MEARPDVARAFLVSRGENESIVIELDEIAEDIADYTVAVQDLMAVVARALGREGRNRSLVCGPAATIEPSTRNGDLIYERRSV